MPIDRISPEEFYKHGIKESPYILPLYGKVHWRRLDVVSNVILEYIDLKSNNLIGDFGCGLGIFTRYMSRQFRWSKIICLDYIKSAKFIELEPDNVIFCRCDIQNIPLKSKCFDLIVSLDTLEHVDNPIEALCDINRVLKDNGLLIVSIPLEMTFLKILREILVRLKIIGDMPINYEHYHGTIKNFKDFHIELTKNFIIKKKIYVPMNLLGVINYGCVFVCKKKSRYGYDDVKTYIPTIKNGNC